MAAGPDERKDQQEAFELVRRGVHVGVVGVAVRALSWAVEDGQGGEACGIRELDMMVSRSAQGGGGVRGAARGTARWPQAVRAGGGRSGVRSGEESGIKEEDAAPTAWTVFSGQGGKSCTRRPGEEHAPGLQRQSGDRKTSPGAIVLNDMGMRGKCCGGLWRKTKL